LRTLSLSKKGACAMAKRNIDEALGDLVRDVA
jgi:hypothetical protein